MFKKIAGFAIRTLLLISFFVVLSIVAKPVTAQQQCGPRLVYNQWSCVTSSTRCVPDYEGFTSPQYCCSTTVDCYGNDQEACIKDCLNPADCALKQCRSGGWARFCGLTSGSVECSLNGGDCKGFVNANICNDREDGTNCTVDAGVGESRDCWVNTGPTATLAPGQPSPTPGGVGGGCLVNGRQDNGETGSDCGGGGCPPCGTGAFDCTQCGYLASSPASTSGDPNVYGTNAYTVANCYRQDNGGAACCSCLDGGTCSAYWNCTSPGEYHVECTQTGVGQVCGPTPGPPTSAPNPTPWIRIRVKNNSGIDIPVSEICRVRCNDTAACIKYPTVCSTNDADFTFPKDPVSVLPDRGGRIELSTQTGSPLTVIGVTPSVIGRAETTCNQLGGYCYVWDFNSWSTGGRDAVLIVATPTPTSTPTPTPTPVPPEPWIKLKDSSFISINSLGEKIPLFPVAYDADDTTDPYFIIGAAGVVAVPFMKITLLNPAAKTGSPEYKDGEYTPVYKMTPFGFLNYVQGRKQHTTVNSLNQISTDGIYIYQGSLVIDNSNPISQAAASKFVLIVDGDVTIDQVKFNIGNDCIDTSTSKSIAILSKTGAIAFSNTSQCAAGVFIASNIDTGSTTNKGLKIVGNLIAQTSLINGREWTNLNIPALFIKFDPVQYINLLPYLSTVDYQWSQRQ